jgi:hypothetical protein
MRIAASLLQVTLAAVVSLAAALTGAGSHTVKSTCQGAVIHTVDANQSPSPACVAIGGIVRIENLGPGLLTTTPAGSVDCFYAAGVHQCRLIHTGAVRFTWTSGSVQRELAVRVISAARPGQPSPACVQPGNTYSVDTNDEMRWWSMCLKVGATLRVQNAGPGELDWNPASAVRCYYEAGVHDCRIVSPGTVTFTSSVPVRSLLVVAIA